MNKNSYKRSPIIIIGMHRSGTTMLSKILEDMGVFMGEKKDINNEALFFLNFNRYIFKQTFATWDSPKNVKFGNDFLNENIKRVFNKRKNSPILANYLGIKKYIMYKKLENLNFDWGWKDPRNSFTLKIWKQLFPNAKVVHIYRNPIDVANSLKKRSISKQEQFKSSFRKQISEYFLRSSFIYDSYKIQNIDEGVHLWKEYVTECLSYPNIFNIKYESLLENPNKELISLFNYLDLNCEDENIQKVSKTIKKNRCYAFLNHTELIENYNKIKNDSLVKQLSYDTII